MEVIKDYDKVVELLTKVAKTIGCTLYFGDVDIEYDEETRTIRVRGYKGGQPMKQQDKLYEEGLDIDSMLEKLGDRVHRMYREGEDNTWVVETSDGREYRNTSGRLQDILTHILLNSEDNE